MWPVKYKRSLNEYIVSLHQMNKILIHGYIQLYLTKCVIKCMGYWRDKTEKLQKVRHFLRVNRPRFVVEKW